MSAEIVAARLRAAGLDLTRTFDVAAYQPEVPPAFALPTFGRASTLGLLVGNSRALWEPFISAYRADPSLHASADPLDLYVERAILAATAGMEVAIRFGHRGSPSPVALQRLCHVSGLAPMAESHLNVHPSFGPWIALRAAIVFDHPGPPPLPPNPACAHCKSACGPAFEAARTQTHSHAEIAARWRDWLAVRDACPVGRDARYSEAQLRYHYTKDRLALDAPT